MHKSYRFLDSTSKILNNFLKDKLMGEFTR